MKRREAESKGEKKRYKHLNAEFQRIARDKKAFLSDQCKEIEENNRMDKTRDLFKKIRDTKGTFHAKMGLIKDRNDMDLTEAEDIKRWQEYREELYKKIIMVIWAIKIIYLYSSSVHSCHLSISSASVRSISFLSFTEPVFA